MRLLIIGGGFIGRHLIVAAKAGGHSVTVLDSRPMTASTDPTVQFILGDVRESDMLFHIIPHFDCVVNLAGILGTSETIDDPFPSIDTNIKGALNVFEAVLKGSALSKRQIRCVQISVGNHFMSNTYAISKSCAERFALMYNQERHTEIAIVRALNAYGPHQKRKPVNKVIPTFIAAALNNQPLPVYGSGEQIMDMIYVGDVARILLAAASVRAEALSGVLEAGTGRRTTINEVAHQVLMLSGSTAGIRYLPMRRGEPRDSEVVGDPSTLAVLGISQNSLVSLEQGLADTIAWYQMNRGTDC